MKIFADFFDNIHTAWPSLGLKSWLFFMALQHKVAHFKAVSPRATGQEKVKGLKTGG